MSEPNETQGQTDPPPDPEATASFGPLDSASELVKILDGYMADLQAGWAPDRDRLLVEHPGLAVQLEQCLAGIEFVHRAADPNSTAGSARLGDFRIVGEIGRGGMGVVYEAEQVSLKRRVALKVLRFGVVADVDAMQRFRREAETVAQLHHTNIVPIFAVGSEHDVHYYAMQFIEGRSLAEVLNESRAEGRPIPAEDVARWGLQVAEALDHAHRRGVIHRDIKPSNLLLDPEGIVWLTDFGLAKRADEVTMTVSGAVMGTPRYMSPEQATVVKRPIDHRTDVYSLGASLYELATGRPLFDAPTAHGVITQILNNEPAPPRQVRPGLPRDLETIVLKCLAKEPDRRYPTVRDLADDLRAFLDGRTIKARRPRPVERAARWAKKQRRSATVAGVTASASVLIVVGAIAGWMAYERLRLGSIVLTTDDSRLTAEVLDDAEDEVVTPSFSLPTQQPVPLPAGSYRVKLSAPGLLSETYQLLVDRGAERRYQVGLGERRLWEPITIQQLDTMEFVDLAGRSDLIQVTSEVLRRLDGAKGRPVWEMSLIPTPGAHGVISADDQERHELLRKVSSDFPPALARPAPDLDGDGVRDLVWASRTSATLWAISGQGKELWRFHAGPGKTWPDKAEAVPVAADVDGDGTPDLIAIFSSIQEKWVEAVSGRSGRSLWRYPLSLGSFPRLGPLGRDHLFPVDVVPVGGKPTIVIVAGTSLIGLDPTTGRDAWPPADLRALTIQAPKVADLDGDGKAEVVVLGERAPRKQALQVISLETRRTLWEWPLTANLEPGNSSTSRPEWPLVADLDGDGKTEVVVPASGAGGASGWAGIEVIGGDGRVRWRRPLRRETYHNTVDRFVAGPDLDGDGVSELFAASIGANVARSGAAELFVDALSGADGHPLWWWRGPASFYLDKVASLRWWLSGPDSRPRLVVSQVTWTSEPGAIHILASEDGRSEHEVAGAFDPILADLDGDGLDDLAYRTGTRNEVTFGGGALHVSRGVPIEPWRRLGVWKPADDLDGDGTTDLVNGQDTRATAISGRDGHPIWQATGVQIAGDSRLQTPRPRADLDGDGTADLLALAESNVRVDPDYERIVVPLQALSGKIGRRLWEAPELRRPGSRHYIFASVQGLQGHDLDGDGRTEVLVIHEMNETLASPPSKELWMGLLSGAKGRWIWRRKLTDDRSGNASSYRLNFSLWKLAPQVADLDGDGVKDIALTLPLPLANNKIAAELRALSGRDGKVLWQRPIAARDDPGGNLEDVLPVPVAGDLDGDGKPEVVYLDRVMNSPKEVEVVAMAGRDGRPARSPWRGRDETPASQGLPRPILVNADGDGRRSVAVMLREPTSQRIVLLDGRGRVRREEIVPSTTWHYGLPLWAHDLDGDGREELVHVVQGFGETKVRAVRSGSGESLWEWSRKGLVTIREIRPAGRARGPFVVLAAMGNEVVGLDGATGKPAWRGPGLPGDSTMTVGDSPLFGSDLLDTGDPSGLPRVVGRSQQATVCRLTVPSRPSGGKPARWSGPAHSPANDPRLFRPLPWAASRDQLSDLVEYALVSAGIALVLLMVPALLIVGSGSRRTWSLARLMILTIVVGLLLAFARLAIPGLARDPLTLLSRALFGLPIVALPGLLAVWLTRKRWWRLGLIVAGSLLLALVLAGIALKLDAPRLAPGQRYSWDGWYGIGLAGAYAAGALAVIIFVSRSLFRLAWRGLRPLVRRSRAA